MGRTLVTTSLPKTPPPLDLVTLSPPPPVCPRVTCCCSCPLSMIPAPCCPCHLLHRIPPSLPCHCRPTSVGTSLPLLPVPTPTSHVSGDVINRHCCKDRSCATSDLCVQPRLICLSCDNTNNKCSASTVPDRGSSHCDGVRSHGIVSCDGRLICHCPCVGNHPREQYGCVGKSCDKLPDPSDNGDVMNHVSGTSPLWCCVNNHRRPVNKLCHSVSVQRDSDSVNNIPERANSRRHCVNNLSNPVNTICRNRVNKSYGGPHDPSENDGSVKHLAGVCDQCDNLNNLCNLVNSRSDSLTTTRDSLNSRSDSNSDIGSVANSPDRREACCDVPITCSYDCDVSLHHASVSSRQLPESVARTARLYVEWCRALLVLPAILVLLLLLLRRKGRRRGLRNVADVLLLLCLLLSHCVALSWVEEDNHSVKLRARFCQPVPEDHLRHMLGAAFDPHRMSSDDPLAGRRRRGDLSLDPRMEDAALDSYSVGDGAVDDAFVRDHEEEEEEGEEDWMNGGVAGRGKGKGGGREVVKREDIMEEEEEEEGEGQFYSREKEDGGSDQQTPPTSTHPPYYDMKRRRKRQASQDTGDASDIATPRRNLLKKSSSRSKNNKGKDLQLPFQRLLLNGRNRKLRRKLKKEIRKKERRLGRQERQLPWTCSMSRSWGRLKEGFFPRYLLDGRCLSDRCFYRLYDCVPQRYSVKLLRRDPDYCNPLPALGANSTYEQMWTVIRYHVTVGCSCGTASSSSSSSSSGGTLNVPRPFLRRQITKS